MSEQDELLLQEIKEILIKPLKVSYQQFADEAMVQGAINQAEEILAKAKQHYEQSLPKNPYKEAPESQAYLEDISHKAVESYIRMIKGVWNVS